MPYLPCLIPWPDLLVVTRQLDVSEKWLRGLPPEFEQARREGFGAAPKEHVPDGTIAQGTVLTAGWLGRERERALIAYGTLRPDWREAQFAPEHFIADIGGEGLSLTETFQRQIEDYPNVKELSAAIERKAKLGGVLRLKDHREPPPQRPTYGGLVRRRPAVTYSPMLLELGVEARSVERTYRYADDEDFKKAVLRYFRGCAIYNFVRCLVEGDLLACGVKWGAPSSKPEGIEPDLWQSDSIGIDVARSMIVQGTGRVGQPLYERVVVFAAQADDTAKGEAERSCLRRMLALADGPPDPTKTKEDYWVEAKTRWPALSRKAFLERVWPAVTAKNPAWAKPGRKPRRAG